MVSNSTIKLLCSYGGKILPRYPDGQLRYHGGSTRVLAVHRSISFSELLMKLSELCGAAVTTLRCQLPAEDLDALVSVTSDEDLANLLEEYDKVKAASLSSLKIRAFLSVPRKASSLSSSSKSSSPNATVSSGAVSNATVSSGVVRMPSFPCYSQSSKPPMFRKYAGKGVYYGSGVGNHCLIHNGNHWQ